MHEVSRAEMLDLDGLGALSCLPNLARPSVTASVTDGAA